MLMGVIIYRCKAYYKNSIKDGRRERELNCCKVLVLPGKW